MLSFLLRTKEENKCTNNEASLGFICLSPSQNNFGDIFMKKGAYDAKVPVLGPRRVIFVSAYREKKKNRN